MPGSALQATLREHWSEFSKQQSRTQSTAELTGRRSRIASPRFGDMEDAWDVDIDSRACRTLSCVLPGNEREGEKER